jgi:methylated-DNA-[protein]-cysteine S-methyltransferase
VTLSYKEMNSPVGKLTLIASAGALVGVLWERESTERSPIGAQNLDPHHPVLVEAERQLSEYFTGKRTQFELPLDPRGTEFQKTVWRALQQIPFGKTKSYAEIAKSIGAPRASRAVGAANGKNPLPIVVPCHRVIGARGALTGFGGGLETKARLLTLEAAVGSGR